MRVRWRGYEGTFFLVTKKRTRRETSHDDEVSTDAGVGQNGLAKTQAPAEPDPPKTPRRKRATGTAGRRGRARLDPAIEAQIDQFGILYPFAFDEFQREALRIFLNGESVMVAAPTGSG